MYYSNLSIILIITIGSDYAYAAAPEYICLQEAPEMYFLLIILRRSYIFLQTD